jgi:hypothetical protein
MIAVHRRAITMIELLISLFIFAACLVPVFDLFRRVSETSRVTQEEVTAFHAAAELVEQVSLVPFAALPLTSGLPLPKGSQELQLVADTPAAVLVLSPLPATFDRELTIEQVSARLKLIKAVVAWGTAPRHTSTCQVLVEWRP